MADTRNSSAAAFALRPLTTGELIDRGFQLYRRHFVALFYFSAATQMIPFALSLVMEFIEQKCKPANFWNLPGPLAAIIGLSVLAFLFQCLGSGALIHYSAQFYLGRAANMKESLKILYSRGWPLLYTTVYQLIILGVSLLVVIVPLAAIYFLGLRFDLLTLLVVLLLLITPFIYFAMLFLIVPQAVMLEPKQGVSALKRSAEIVRYDPKLGFMYWGETRLSILLLVVGIIHLMLIVVSHLPELFAWMEEMMRGNFNVNEIPIPSAISTICHLLAFLSNSLVTPLYLIAGTVFYYDVRVRKEAYDLEMIAGTMGQESSNPTSSTP